MKIDRRITNGLAWAGVLLVVGVPTADMLISHFSDDKAATVAPQVGVVAPAVASPEPAAGRPVEVAATTPAAPIAAPSGDAVDSFVNSGRPLPSYITGGGTPAAPVAPKPAPVAVAPAPVVAPTPVAQPAAPTQTAATPPVRTPIATPAPVVTPQPAVTDPIAVAAIPPQRVAPVPMPLSMRPRPVVQPSPVVSATLPIVIPPSVNQNLPPVVRPPVAVVQPADNLTSADLDDWESGPLSEFLAQRQAQGNNGYVQPPATNGNGFFLDQWPQQGGRDRLIGREEQPLFGY
ncbi:hypothetical protein [Devosia sp. 2618]|uniref:hypothetical protein n=1 Tax=Devosia sp. 2618 TaxID=3156454 RepID=UPI003390DEA2